MKELENHDNIPLVLETLFPDGSQYLPIIALNLSNIEDYWMSNPDFRFTQVLVNLGLIPNMPGTWYSMEDEELIISAGILEGRDIYFWGKNFDKTGKRLKETEYILIRDMETPHIESIIRDNSEGLLRVNKRYLELFYDEINHRKN